MTLKLVCRECRSAVVVLDLAEGVRGMAVCECGAGWSAVVHPVVGAIWRLARPSTTHVGDRANLARTEREADLAGPAPPTSTRGTGSRSNASLDTTT